MLVDELKVFYREADLRVRARFRGHAGEGEYVVV
jgi:hypothetical protein